MSGNLEGIWEGYFVYGNGYTREERRTKASFTINFKIDYNLVSGTCTDDLTKELRLPPATIEGIFESGTIKFLKKYSCLITQDEHFNNIAVHNEPSALIHYSGSLRRKFFSRKYFLKGKWEVTGTFIDQFGEVQSYFGNGKWVAFKRTVNIVFPAKTQ